MSQGHPSDEQLLLYLEGERPGDVAGHVVACPRCRDALAAAPAGRDALRAAPLLKLPAARREALLAALPRQERPLARRRLLAVVLALVALAAVVGAVALTGRSDPERTADELRREAERDAPAAALEAAPAEDAAAVRSVAGPPREVAALLRKAGLDARVVNGAVEVTGATDQEVAEALRGREPGGVEVRVRR
jgi:hypothetical protein